MDESAKNSNAVKTNCTSNYEAKIKIPDKVVGESNDVDSDTGRTEKSKLPGTISCDKIEGMNESVKVEVLNVDNNADVGEDDDAESVGEPAGVLDDGTGVAGLCPGRIMTKVLVG